MTKTLLASVAMLFAVTATSFASAPVASDDAGITAKSQAYDMEAKRRKPRVPGGSGCDSPRDVAEHPECRVKKADAATGEDAPVLEAKRRKPRVPGGSGCDTPRDVAEHAECRV